MNELPTQRFAVIGGRLIKMGLTESGARVLPYGRYDEMPSMSKRTQKQYGAQLEARK